MPLAVRADSTEFDRGSDRSTSTSRRTKFMVAGVAMASAGALAVNPVAPTPAMPEVRAAAVELSALANPLTAWQHALNNTLTSLTALSGDISGAQTGLGLALTNPALYNELLEFVTQNATNPLALPTALLNFPSTYGGTITAALTDLLTAQERGLTTLPTALAESLGWLSKAEFVEAFGVLNVWFLVNVLGESRQTLLDAFAIPGDFFESIGAEPIARVFDALLTRGTAGNLGRALLTAQVTSTIQFMEVLDLTRAAIQAGELDTAVSELMDLPAKYVNAFLNGYVPGFPIDYPSSPNQQFPGIFHELGFVNFFLVQIPNAIAGALAPPVTADTFTTTEETAPGPLEIPTGENAIAVKFQKTSTDNEKSFVPDDSGIVPSDGLGEGDGLGDGDSGGELGGGELGGGDDLDSNDLDLDIDLDTDADNDLDGDDAGDGGTTVTPGGADGATPAEGGETPGTTGDDSDGPSASTDNAGGGDGANN
ncbi:hypothetical protein [Mycolicibacterium sp. XJ1819]